MKIGHIAWLDEARDAVWISQVVRVAYLIGVPSIRPAGVRISALPSTTRAAARMSSWAVMRSVL
ncbi:hypothetical protein AB0J55_28605 [Amycolatopsis sp. NPDC049688]|uniref:hypothetical protein n=1 Tax=Amycolatopsis sp. NPDC049688 TaxID=3154733 RepID=UPI00343B7644